MNVEATGWKIDGVPMMQITDTLDDDLSKSILVKWDEVEATSEAFP